MASTASAMHTAASSVRAQTQARRKACNKENEAPQRKDATQMLRQSMGLQDSLREAAMSMPSARQVLEESPEPIIAQTTSSRLRALPTPCRSTAGPSAPAAASPSRSTAGPSAPAAASPHGFPDISPPLSPPARGCLPAAPSEATAPCEMTEKSELAAAGPVLAGRLGDLARLALWGGDMPVRNTFVDFPMASPPTRGASSCVPQLAGSSEPQVAVAAPAPKPASLELWEGDLPVKNTFVNFAINSPPPSARTSRLSGDTEPIDFKPQPFNERELESLPESPEPFRMLELEPATGNSAPLNAQVIESRAVDLDSLAQMLFQVHEASPPMESPEPFHAQEIEPPAVELVSLAQMLFQVPESPEPFHVQEIEPLAVELESLLDLEFRMQKFFQPQESVPPAESPQPFHVQVQQQPVETPMLISLNDSLNSSVPPKSSQNSKPIQLNLSTWLVPSGSRASASTSASTSAPSDGPLRICLSDDHFPLQRGSPCPVRRQLFSNNTV